MTEAMPFLQKYDITFLRPPPIRRGIFIWADTERSAPRPPMTAFPDTKQQKIRLTKTVRRIFVDKNLVAQLMIHQIAQRVHSSSFIAAIGD